MNKKKILLLATLFLSLFTFINQHGYAQAPSWPLFGTYVYPWSLHDQHLLNCGAGTLTTISQEVECFDPSTPNNSHGFPNAGFDKTGNLIFTANKDGLHDATGACFYNFGDCEFSRAEIEILPIHNSCDKYYVLYWATSLPAPGKHCVDDAGLYLKLLTVEPNPSGGMMVSSSVNLLADHTYPAPVDYTTHGLGIVADKIQSNGDRDVYTQDGYYIRKWTFYENGTYTTTSTTITSAAPINEKYLCEMANGILAYPSDINILTLYNITTASYTNIVLPYPTGGYHGDYQISGFEYVPSNTTWYISYVSPSAPGIYYQDVSTALTPSYISGSDEYRFTDLELAKNNKLYCIGTPYPGLTGPPTGLTEGNLAYIDILSSPYAVPTYLSPAVPVNNFNPASGFALMNQLDEDNYSKINCVCKADFSYSINTERLNRVTLNYSTTPGYIYLLDMGGDPGMTNPFPNVYDYSTAGKRNICLGAFLSDGSDRCGKCIGICINEFDIVAVPCGADFTYELSTADPFAVKLTPNYYIPTHEYDFTITDQTTASIVSMFNGSGLSTTISLPDRSHEYKICLQEYELDKAGYPIKLVCEVCITMCPLADGVIDEGRTIHPKPAITYSGAPELKIYPNPATDNTNLEFSIAEDAMVNIEVKDALGKTVYIQNNTKLNAGKQSISLPTQSLASGLYHVVANSDKWTITKRLSVIK